MQEHGGPGREFNLIFCQFDIAIVQAIVELQCSFILLGCTAKLALLAVELGQAQVPLGVTGVEGQSPRCEIKGLILLTQLYGIGGQPLEELS